MLSHYEPPRKAIERAIARTDYTRRSPFSVGGRGGHKEWHHFCVPGPDINLVVNFSLSDDVRPEAAPGAELARVAILVRHETWDGDVDTFSSDEVRAGGGRIDLAFGENQLRFENGAYHVSVSLRQRPITVDLTFSPLTLPSIAPNIPLPDGLPLRWVIVPRLRATGHVTLDGRTFHLTDVLAYHDHNWGHFLWGHAFAWMWGFSLPIDANVPWSLSFVRLTNRTRTRALAQGLFVWKHAWSDRVFRDHDIEMRTDIGHLRPSRTFRIPRVMAMLSPETPTDVPRWVEIRAQADGDSLLYRFEADELAQVVIPSETDLSVTIINEVTGRSSVHGQIRGETIAIEGRAVCEFLVS